MAEIDALSVSRGQKKRRRHERKKGSKSRFSIPLTGWLGSSDVGLPLAILLILSVTIGAGGVPAVRTEGLVVIAAIATALVAVLRDWKGTGERPGIALRTLVLSVPALAALQLIPLPFGIWSALPVRGPLVAAFSTIGATPWWPLSTVPQATLWALLSLVPPLVAFHLAFRLPANERWRFVGLIAALSVASGVLGGLQALLGDAFFLHSRSINAGPSGFFANQNTQADFLIIGVLCCIALLSRKSANPAAAPLFTGAAVFLAVSVVITGSRAGMAMLILPLAFACVVFSRRIAQLRRKSLAGAILLVAIAGVTVLAMQSSRVQAALARFSDLSGGRITDIWPDSWYLAKEAFPFGTGIGTFRDSFELIEQLGVVDATRANRAHFDWLEFIIEGGLPAAAILALLVVLLMTALVRKIRTGIARLDQLSFMALGVIAIHSIVDYPLRAIAMAVVAAMFLAWIFSDGTHIDSEL